MIARSFAVLCLVSLASGCSIFRRPEPVSVPHEFQALDLNGDNKTQALKAAFPPVKGFSVTSDASAQKRVLWKKYGFNLLLSMVTDQDGKVRLIGRHQGDQLNLIDLYTDGSMMCVLTVEGVLFTGDIPPEGSPIGQLLGFEPVDLIGICTLGSQLVSKDPQWKTNSGFLHKGKLLAVPRQADAADEELKRVEFDDETSLPRRADWRRANVRWGVDYLAWEYVTGAGGGAAERWLMPTHVRIHHYRPSLNIDVRVRQYNAMNPPPEPRRFRCPEKPGAQKVELQALTPAMAQLLQSK